jgi:hypothetical protein
MRKPRSDGKLLNLPEERRGEILDLLEQENARTAPAVTSDSKLSDEEKQRRMKQIFGVT